MALVTIKKLGYHKRLKQSKVWANNAIMFLLKRDEIHSDFFSSGIIYFKILAPQLNLFFFFFSNFNIA